MKLAIILAYMISAEQEPLLRLHLEHIKRFTTVPYTINGVILHRKFPKELIKLLESTKHLNICDVPTFNIDLKPDQSSHTEHSYYLDQLTKIAVEDNASHVVVLHPDSFPIHAQWAQKLSQKLSDTCVIASADGFYTACFMFTSEFYIKFKPEFNPPIISEKSEEFQKFLTTHPFIAHTGFGYFYKAYQNKLDWYFMKDTVLPEDKRFGFEIHDGIVFHWGGASRLAITQTKNNQEKPTLLQKVLYAFRGLIPVNARYHLAKFIYPLLGNKLKKKVMNNLNIERAHHLQEFQNNPTNYIGKYYSN